MDLPELESQGIATRIILMPTGNQRTLDNSSFGMDTMEKKPLSLMNSTDGFLGTTSFDSQTDIPFPSILSMERYHLLLGRLSSLVINTQETGTLIASMDGMTVIPLRGELKLYGNLALLKYPTTGSPLLQPLSVMTNEEWLEENRLLNLYRNL